MQWVKPVPPSWIWIETQFPPSQAGEDFHSVLASYNNT